VTELYIFEIQHDISCFENGLSIDNKIATRVYLTFEDGVLSNIYIKRCGVDIMVLPIRGRARIMIDLPHYYDIITVEAETDVSDGFIDSLLDALEEVIPSHGELVSHNNALLPWPA